MKIHELYRRTNKTRKYLAQYVRIVASKSGYKNGLGYIAAKTQSTHRLDHRGFLVPVKARQRKTYLSVITFIDSKLNVKVSCSCDDFWARHEVALHHRNAADIEYSNGEWPVITNPEGKVRMCKHLCALYKKVESRIPR